MKIKASLLAGLVASAPFAFAQDIEVATDPVGYVSVDLVAAGDTIVSVPMHRAPVFQGIPESIDGSSINFAAGTGIQPENPEYFVMVRSGSLAGVRANVVGVENDGDTLVIDDQVDLSGLNTGEGGDAVQLIPHWTLSTLFPEDLPIGTQVLVYDRNVAGINKSSVNEYEWFEAGGDFGTVWIDRDSELADDDVIFQGESVVIRSDAGSSVSFVMAGSVPMAAHRDSLLTTAAGIPQDQHIGLMVPTDVKVGELQDLGFPASPGDQILVFDNSVGGINKSSVEEYEAFEFEGDIVWINRDSELVGDDDILRAGVGYIFRKAATDSPSEVVWTYNPNYLESN